jgi:16S rRNA G966 N2-methylase RsmD
LGRGAAIAVAVEQSGRACGVIRHNWHLMTHDRTAQVAVIRSAVLPFLQRLGDRPPDPASSSTSNPTPNPCCNQPFDLIYFDPPYACGWYDPVLQAIAHAHILAPEGELAVEYSPKYWTPAAIVPSAAIRPSAAIGPSIDAHPSDDSDPSPQPAPAAMVLDRQKAYGNTHLALYRWATDARWATGTAPSIPSILV